MSIQEFVVEKRRVDVFVYRAIQDGDFLAMASENKFTIRCNDCIIEPFSRLKFGHRGSSERDCIYLGDLSLEISLAIRGAKD